MPTLHVRNVPDALYNRLREQAQKQNRSLSAEVIVLLDSALDESQQAQDQLLDSIRRRRFYNPSKAGAPDSTTLLRRDRER